MKRLHERTPMYYQMLRCWYVLGDMVNDRGMGDYYPHEPHFSLQHRSRGFNPNER